MIKLGSRKFLFEKCSSGCGLMPSCNIIEEEASDLIAFASFAFELLLPRILEIWSQIPNFRYILKV